MTQRPDQAVRGFSQTIDDDELDIATYLREEGEEPHIPPPQSLMALVIGAVGVVYGDIGTSPLYAFREALRPVAADGLHRAEVLGLLSLLIWTLILIVTVKYVLFLLRSDNRGEGGVLALYTLARLAIGRRSIPVLLLALAGAALFFGDAIITPAISVLSAVEGVSLVVPAFHDWIVPATVAILIGLFLVQKAGTAHVSRFFGPITVIWFLTMGGMGLWHIVDDPAVLAAFNPVWLVRFLLEHQGVAFVVMGSVFLAVTGAEALYADLGHFGRRPIVLAWFSLIFPALVLNYLGQGALVLRDHSAIEAPFYAMVPPWLLPALVVLATAATVIAAQAVISGAFSMTRSAIQLGLLPRMRIRHTSAQLSGQIYIPAINWGLLIGVLWLVNSFRTSEALASAYGIAVTGTMLVTTALALIYLRASRRMPLWIALAMLIPIGVIELSFLSANMVKVWDGGYVPLLLAFALGIVMWAWWSGTQTVAQKTHRAAVDFASFCRSMADSSVHVVPGTALFLTSDPTVVPSALLHNLKHNRVLHQQNVLLTVETLRVPVATPEERATFEPVDDRFGRLTLRFGYMETPNVSRAMLAARKAGLKFDVMNTSFFLGRRRPIFSSAFGVARLLASLYALLYRFSADPSDYFRLPRNRVVELGERFAA
ncbi:MULTISPECIES: potassium transporter Kup [Paracoccus]|uniref:Probable potassium transport system protein Kup n=1 Tax=Paracoccus fontiphilus TaxID=1815556 RepID=A0ABV7II01_9RHOB|nr:potassium transporter Kup [Paracoccus fontiphilus]